MFNFAQRILASSEVAAVSEEQFDLWPAPRQQEYLRHHPNSQFGNKPKLERHHADMMQKHLSDDIRTSDKDLVHHFTRQGVPRKHAQKAVQHRNRLLRDRQRPGWLHSLLAKKA